MKISKEFYIEDIIDGAFSKSIPVSVDLNIAYDNYKKYENEILKHEDEIIKIYLKIKNEK